jgi:hypothetical protein
MITLKDLGPFLIQTKKMSIPHVAAISAIGLTTVLTYHFAYTNIKLYERKYNIMYQKEQLDVDKDRFAFDKDRLTLDKDRDNHALEFRRAMLELDRDRLAFDRERRDFDGGSPVEPLP